MTHLAHTSLAELTDLHTAVVFRDQAPQEDSEGPVHALAIRDVVSSKPLTWTTLPRVAVSPKYVDHHCLQTGDVVLPARGAYYKAWHYTGPAKRVLPIGQLHVIRPHDSLDAGFLVWYLNQPATQAKLMKMLTGTSIQAITKSALGGLPIELPPMARQRHIAEIADLTRQINTIRHRLNELDQLELAQLGERLLALGSSHA